MHVEREATRPMKKDNQSILLIQLGDIGDVVLSIPAFRAVQESFPQAKIVVAVREKVTELIPHIPWVNDVIAVNQDRRTFIEAFRHQWAFFSRVRRFHFDLAFDFRISERGAVLAFLSGAKERIGFYDPEGFWRNRLFTRLRQDRREDRESMHMSAYYSSLIRAYGLTVTHEKPEIHVREDVRQRAEHLLRQEGVAVECPIIVLQPFSLWRYKEWNMEKYTQLIRRMLSAFQVSVVITGSADESERARELVARFGDKERRVFNLAGKTSLGELAGVLQASKLFVGVDSAGMHIAAAVGTPTIAIFGPSSPDSWAPSGRQHFVVQKDLPCVPCRQKGCDGSEFSRCLEELAVEDVWAIAESQCKALDIPTLSL